MAEYYVLLAGGPDAFTLTDKRQRLQLDLNILLANDFRAQTGYDSITKSLPRLLSVSVEALRVGSLQFLAFFLSSGSGQTPPPRADLLPSSYRTTCLP